MWTRFGIGALAATALSIAACSASPDETTSASDEQLVTQSFTYVTKGNALALETNLVARVTACRAARRPSCVDADRDGLVDAWERLVIERFRPAITFDEAEKLVHSAGKDKVAYVARVAPSSSTRGHVLVNFAIAYSRDYGSPVGYCFSTSAHVGDVEHVAVELALSDSGNSVVVKAFTTGHEGTDDDQSRVWTSDGLRTLEYVIDDGAGGNGQPRWRVYASEGKHATYATKSQCEHAHFPFPDSVCIREDCGPDGVSSPSEYTRVPPFTNAGEPSAHLVGDLAPLGFAGETAWSAHFCGGVPMQDTSACPGLSSKLRSNPFR